MIWKEKKKQSAVTKLHRKGVRKDTGGGVNKSLLK